MSEKELLEECNKRLGILYQTKHRWLLSEARKLTKNSEDAEDLVSELYEYLQTKCNPKLFWGDSYNIFYCNKFIYSRFVNSKKKGGKNIPLEGLDNIEDTDLYNYEMDERFEIAHNQILAELQRLRTTKLWPKAKIFELYWCSDDTLEETSNRIGISKSTTFIAVKEIRKWLRVNIKNPFKPDDNDSTTN